MAKGLFSFVVASFVGTSFFVASAFSPSLSTGRGGLRKSAGRVWARPLTAEQLLAERDGALRQAAMMTGERDAALREVLNMLYVSGTRSTRDPPLQPTPSLPPVNPGPSPLADEGARGSVRDGA